MVWPLAVAVTMTPLPTSAKLFCGALIVVVALVCPARMVTGETMLRREGAFELRVTVVFEAAAAGSVTVTE